MSELNTSLDHLPRAKQQELARVVEILHEEFQVATAHKTSAEKRSARIFKIILFGSFARGTWVEDMASGYKSDYDLLVVVNSKWLTDYVDYWEKAFDRIMFDPAIDREVNFIVHSLEDVNSNLSEGQYFFTDIRREGIALYDLKGSKPLAMPRNLSATEAFEVSKKYYDLWFPKIEGALDGAKFHIEKKSASWAAFMLHQVVECAYSCVQLTFTHYVPGTHSIKFLRSLAEQQDERLTAAWPRDKTLPNAKKHKAAYELLAEAYVKARYSEHFTITDEQLNWLTAQTEELQKLVKQVCEARLEQMRGKVEG